jgi:hypothetical protein
MEKQHLQAETTMEVLKSLLKVLIDVRARYVETNGIGMHAPWSPEQSPNNQLLLLDRSNCKY